MCPARRRGTQWSLEHACNGWLAGLVSITACASVVDSTISLVVGALGGFVYCAASHVVARVAIVGWACGERAMPRASVMRRRRHSTSCLG